MKILCINTAPLDLSYFTKRNLSFDVTYITDTQKYPLVHFKDADNGTGQIVPFYTPWPEDYLKNKYKNFDYSIIIVGWNPTDYSSLTNGTGGYTNSDSLPSGTFWCTVRLDGSQNAYVVHELHHALVGILNVNFKLNHSNATQVRDFMDLDSQNRPYFENFSPETIGSNHYQTWIQIAPHLDLLKSITYTQSMTYKYFSPKEVAGLKDELVSKLDMARGISGIPYKITSGYRDPAHNAAVGGVNGSSHTLGIGCDISAVSSNQKFLIIKGAIQAGFNRIGIYADHIHLDCGHAPSFPQDVLWTSEKE